MGIDPITAGIGAVGAIAGGILGSKGQKNTTTSAPWAPVQPYLKAGLADTAYQYGQQRGSPYYSGDLYANMDPRSIAGANGIYGYAGNQGAANAARVSAPGQPLIDQFGNVISNANGLTGFNPQDPTQSNIANAGMYADNPYVNGMVDAASRDITRNLSENQLPQLNRTASAGGNTNSDRTAIQSAILQRGAADRVGDISSQMRGDLYNSGLNLSEQARSTNQSDRLNAMVQGGSLADRALARGLDATGQGQQLAYDNFDAMTKAGGLYQQDAQGNLNAAFDQWNGQDQRAWDLLNRYNSSINGGMYPTSSTTLSGGGLNGALQGALGAGTSALGLYGSYRNLNASAPASGIANPNLANRNMYTGMMPGV